MRVQRAILRDYVRVGSKHTQQLNDADFTMTFEDGWIRVHLPAGDTYLSPASIIQVDCLPWQTPQPAESPLPAVPPSAQLPPDGRLAREEAAERGGRDRLRALSQAPEQKQRSPRRERAGKDAS